MQVQGKERLLIFPFLYQGQLFCRSQMEVRVDSIVDDIHTRASPHLSAFAPKSARSFLFPLLSHPVIQIQ